MATEVQTPTGATTILLTNLTASVIGRERYSQRIQHRRARQSSDQMKQAGCRRLWSLKQMRLRHQVTESGQVLLFVEDGFDLQSQAGDDVTLQFA